jgi:hypothetical protein
MKILTLHQKEKLQEERRKKDEEEAKLLYDDFAKSFDSETNKIEEKNIDKPFNTSSSISTHHSLSKSSLIKPSEIFSTFEEEEEETLLSKGNRQPVPSSSSKRKRNLDTFLEEIKKEHDQKEEKSSKQKPLPHHQEFKSFRPQDVPYHLGENPPDENITSTNLYISGLPMYMTEEELMAIFSFYGPVASVKILWPRTEEDHLKGKNCGFVNFVERKHAEEALNQMDGYEIAMHHFLKVCWGKAIRHGQKPYPSHSGESRSYQREYEHSHKYEDELYKKSSYTNEESLNMSKNRSDVQLTQKESVEKEEKGKLTPEELKEWEYLLSQITYERTSIANVMYFAILHSEAAKQVIFIMYVVFL